MDKATRSKKGRASRSKGKVGERELAELLQGYGFKAHRAQQFKGKAGDEDITHDMEGFHIECKRVEAFRLYDALGQAAGDAKPGNKPIVFHRPNGKPWVAVMLATDFLETMQELYEDE